MPLTLAHLAAAGLTGAIRAAADAELAESRRSSTQADNPVSAPREP